MSTWEAPLCDDCWDKLAPSHPSPRLDCGEEETCTDCAQPTRSGIYIRREREIVVDLLDGRTLTVHVPAGVVLPEEH
jgi:hypothetical protein